ncbi:hypothetical protein B0H11DRAFT_1925844 [Mycena galericulata]|nr:hypothetical protein B0H11DRAFT_1925844 [Mycena galericulata]
MVLDNHVALFPLYNFDFDYLYLMVYFLFGRWRAAPAIGRAAPRRPVFFGAVLMARKQPKLLPQPYEVLNERALTVEEKAQNEHWAELGGAIIEGGVARAAALASGEGAHTLSWIWYTINVRADDDDDPRLHDGKFDSIGWFYILTTGLALRLEWCKAYARAKRYSEDVRLLNNIHFGREVVIGL